MISQFKFHDLHYSTLYWYRFGIENSSLLSPVGTFKTAPLQNDSTTSVLFVFSGDSDGAKNKRGTESYYAHDFDVMKAAANENPDFFLFISDITRFSKD